jgi:uncharacterized phage protein (TIGR01671 family)
MIEHKFRAWDSFHNRFLDKLDDWKDNIFLQVGDGSDEGLLQYADENDSPAYMESCGFDDRYFLLPFTGFKDKNEEEIYCGYILSEKWKVEVYQNDEGTFMVKFHNNPKLNKPKTLKKYLFSREKALTSEIDCVIIGNIYEHSELLDK